MERARADLREPRTANDSAPRARGSPQTRAAHFGDGHAAAAGVALCGQFRRQTKSTSRTDGEPCR